MKALERALLAGWVMIAVATGCRSSARGPDSETNWFETCATNHDCTGATQCLCGRCTIPCGADDACEPAPPGAACTSLADIPGCTGAEAGGRCTVAAKAIAPPLNPTGTCTAPNSGARAGALPGEGDVWLPDCKLGLTREYWRVFVRPTGTAYILPDPLAVPQRESRPCGDEQNPLYEILTRYSFCNPPSTDRPSDEMTPADALTVAHYYHVGGYGTDTGFLFEAVASAILPNPFLADVMDACKLTTADDAPGLSALCDQAAALLAHEATGADVGQDLDRIYDGQPGADVAYLLNRLYGIDAPRVTLGIDPELCDLPSDPTTCQSTSTRYFWNPVTARCEPRSYGTCGGALVDFATEEACRGACNGRAKSCEQCDATISSAPPFSVPPGCVQADDCSGCPAAAPSDSAACPNAGLACTYGSGCSYRTCLCHSDGTGGMAWSCLDTAC